MDLKSVRSDLTRSSNGRKSDFQSDNASSILARVTVFCGTDETESCNSSKVVLGVQIPCAALNFML